MRRLLAAAALATAALPAAPASAVCTPYVTNIRACGIVQCYEGYCEVQPYVDPQCVQNHLHTLHCQVIDDLLIPLPV